MKELLQKIKNDRDFLAKTGNLRPLGKNVLLRVLSDRDLSETKSELMMGLDGKPMAKVGSDAIIAFEVEDVGPDVKGDIKPGDIAVCYPAVSTRFSDGYVICPEDGIAAAYTPETSADE